jgi:hypothetical protein
MSESTLARARDALVALVLLLPLLVPNIEKPHFCRVGVICCSLRAAAQQIRTARKKGGETKQSEGWQGASVGAVSAKTLLVFVLARNRRLDRTTVRAVADGVHPSGSAVTKDSEANLCGSINAVGRREGHA